MIIDEIGGKAMIGDTIERHKSKSISIGRGIGLEGEIVIGAEENILKLLTTAVERGYCIFDQPRLWHSAIEIVGAMNESRIDLTHIGCHQHWAVEERYIGAIIG